MPTSGRNGLVPLPLPPLLAAAHSQFLTFVRQRDADAHTAFFYVLRNHPSNARDVMKCIARRNLLQLGSEGIGCPLLLGEEVASPIFMTFLGVLLRDAVQARDDASCVRILNSTRQTFLTLVSLLQRNRDILLAALRIRFISFFMHLVRCCPAKPASSAEMDAKEWFVVVFYQ